MRFALTLVSFAVLASWAVCPAPPVSAQGDAPRPSLTVKIAVPQGGAVAARDDRSHFHVVIENVSAQPQKVIDEWNSWGYFNLRFEYTTAAGEKKRMEKLGRDWSKNFLTTTTLQPGEATVWDVHLDPAVWSDLPVPEKGEQTVSIRAVFAQEDPKVDAWRGKVESPEQKITFRNYRKP
jgi:hypothetical protein